MKKITIIFSIFLVLAFCLTAIPHTALADEHNTGGGTTGPGTNTGGGTTGPGTNTGGGTEPGSLTNNPSVKLRNPLGENSSITKLIANIIDFLTKLAAVILTIMILIGAWQLMTSAGNPEKAKTAKMTLVWAAVGFAIVLMAQGIGIIIKSFFN